MTPREPLLTAAEEPAIMRPLAEKPALDEPGGANGEAPVDTRTGDLFAPVKAPGEQHGHG
ncbi:hypothetical protein AXF24_13375 [Streptococcus pneumoniae]|nr:hypothetical protein AWW74_13385 [Streptococcus pneumoniae]KXB95920.1 hypothetical protein AXF24_13375 [Streptococcus pneumoniae]